MFPVVWALPRWGRKVNRWLLIVVYLFVFCLFAGCLIVAAAQWAHGEHECARMVDGMNY